MTDNVVRLVDRAPHPLGDTASFADWLHAWADAIATGEYGEVHSLIVVIERKDGRLGKVSQSAGIMDNARACGLLFSAAHRCADGQLTIERLKEG